MALATIPEQVETVFVREAQLIPGINRVYDHEPERPPGLPGVTMLMTRFDQSDTETGSGVTAYWDWRINVYASLREWPAGQRNIRRLYPEVLKITRRNPSMDGLVEFAEVRDAGEEPVFAPEESYILKAFRLSCRLTLYGG